MLKPWIWLRVAAMLQALGIVGHNLATLSTKATHGPAERAVFDAMRGFQFDIMGSTRSVWDFYRGYQFMTTIYFALILALLWMLSNMSRSAPRVARPLVVAILVAHIFFVIIAWDFFFAGPGVVGGAMGLCIAIAAIELYGADQLALGMGGAVSA